MHNAFVAVGCAQIFRVSEIQRRILAFFFIIISMIYRYAVDTCSNSIRLLTLIVLYSKKPRRRKRRQSSDSRPRPTELIHFTTRLRWPTVLENGRAELCRALYTPTTFKSLPGNNIEIWKHRRWLVDGKPTGRISPRYTHTHTPIRGTITRLRVYESDYNNNVVIVDSRLPSYLTAQAIALLCCVFFFRAVIACNYYHDEAVKHRSVPDFLFYTPPSRFHQYITYRRAPNTNQNG